MLVPVPEMFDALSKGVYEMNMTVFAFDAQWLPELTVGMSLPGSWETLEQCQKFFYDYGGLDFFRESYAQHNQYLLRHLPCTRNSLMTKERVNTWSDLKGMKIWAEPPQSYPIRDLGGAVTLMPLEDLYMALKLGTLDGCVYSEPELETLHFYEVLNYVYHPSIQELLCMDMTINLDAWNSLPTDLQNDIEAIMDEIVPQMCRTYQAQEKVGTKFFEEHGGTVVDLPADMAAELHRVSRDCWDEIAAESDRSAQAVQLLRNFMEGEGIE
ncbi:Lactate-binding periplasmic protein [subsurface metagenome]